MSPNRFTNAPNPNNTLDLIAVLLISFGLLVTSAIAGIFIGYPLITSLLLFMGVLVRRGFSGRSLICMGAVGARQSLPVVQVLLLIGVVTATWMAAGTVPALVYYGTALISPRFFILWAFLLSGAVSILLGTSFGTVGTIGIALMVIARSSGAEINPVAGALIAGAYVGDRCSPMSSSAHLVASITCTDLYANLRRMIRSALWPLLISLVFYTVLSLRYPVTLSASPITAELPQVFDISAIVLLPAISMLLLAMVRVNVKLAMAVSIGIAAAIAHHSQQVPLLKLFQFALFGYQLAPDSPLQTIL
ncbi:MAG: Na+/H+ antiporter NhaC family protein, partial [Phormidesmis sp.]